MAWRTALKAQTNKGTSARTSPSMHAPPSSLPLSNTIRDLQPGWQNKQSNRCISARPPARILRFDPPFRSSIPIRYTVRTRARHFTHFLCLRATSYALHPRILPSILPSFARALAFARRSSIVNVPTLAPPKAPMMFLHRPSHPVRNAMEPPKRADDDRQRGHKDRILRTFRERDARLATA